MIPILCFVGAKNVGKTTVLEKLIPELVNRGYRVGTVKHDVHGFDVDREGKDTWRHGRAGASTVVISSPQGLALMKKRTEEMPLDRIVARFFWEEEIVLTEGFKKSVYPKIEVFRKEISNTLLCSKQDNLIAIVGDKPEESLEVEHFGWDEIDGLADFIEGRYLSKRKKRDAFVLLDGKRLPINNFVEEIITSTVEGLLKTLRGWDEPSDILLSIRRTNDT